MTRAYVTTALGVESLIGAETRGQARSRTARAARAAGFDVRFRDVRALRAPEFDSVVKQLTVPMTREQATWLLKGCAECGEPGVVGVGTPPRWLCMIHFDAAMAKIGSAVRAGLEVLRDPE